MSRKSRRKTLSHAEIENFLCDLGNEEMEGMKSGAGLVVALPEPEPELDAAGPSSENEIEGIESSASLEQQRSDDKSYRASVVRAFHKDLLAAQGSGRHSPSMNEYAKIIHSETDYALLPTRQIYPENFKHPITSLESKKALLMSMQPMLSAAEKQRKTDSELLENFTRCKVGKSRARSSTYEYLDFDTNLRISGKEYSRRYLLYLAEKRAADNTSINISNISQSSQSNSTEGQCMQDASKDRATKNHLVLQDISLNFTNSNMNTTTNNSSSPAKKQKANKIPTASSTDLDFLMSFDEDVDVDKRGRKDRSRNKGRNSSRCRDDDSSGVSSRRRTLSPASTKAILQQEIEDTLLSESDSDMKSDLHEMGGELSQSGQQKSPCSPPNTNMDIENSETHEGDVNIDAVSLRRNASSGKKRSLPAAGSGGVGGAEFFQSPLKVQLQSSSPATQLIDVPDIVIDTEDDARIDPFIDIMNITSPIAVKPKVISHKDEEGILKYERVSTGDDSLMRTKEGFSAFEGMSCGVEEVLINESASPDAQSECNLEILPQNSNGELNEEEQEERALKRYELRLEVAKWKFFWEVASAGAARAAAAKMSKSS